MENMMENSGSNIQNKQIYTNYNNTIKTNSDPNSSTEAVVRGAKQQQKKGGNGRNMRALGLIGNLITVRGVEGKPQPQPQVHRERARRHNWCRGRQRKLKT
ncbi:hypothetical protein ACOSQ3_024430 [Xanthoceras sorbifolium]